MKALRPLVGRLDPLALLSSVVVHHHAVHAQNDHFRVPEPQSPEKQLLDQTSKQPDPPQRERVEKPLDLMRRGHRFGIDLDRSGIAFRLLQIIEANQRKVGPVQKKAEQLVEKNWNRQSLLRLPHRTEQPFQHGEEARRRGTEKSLRFRR
jgi:hypothetical protein